MLSPFTKYNIFLEAHYYFFGYPRSEQKTYLLLMFPCSRFNTFLLHLQTTLPYRHENQQQTVLYGGELLPKQFYSSTGLHDWQALDVTGAPLRKGGPTTGVLGKLRYSKEHGTVNEWMACYLRTPTPNWII